MPHSGATLPAFSLFDGFTWYDQLEKFYAAPGLDIGVMPPPLVGGGPIFSVLIPPPGGEL